MRRCCVRLAAEGVFILLESLCTLSNLLLLVIIVTAFALLSCCCLARCLAAFLAVLTANWLPLVGVVAFRCLHCQFVFALALSDTTSATRPNAEGQLGCR